MPVALMNSRLSPPISRLYDTRYPSVETSVRFFSLSSAVCVYFSAKDVCVGEGDTLFHLFAAVASFCTVLSGSGSFSLGLKEWVLVHTRIIMVVSKDSDGADYMLVVSYTTKISISRLY